MVSFDIFDTLITRRTELPEGIFLCMQEELLQHKSEWDLPDQVMHSFALWRDNAEKLARHQASGSRCEEVTLQFIYEVLCNLLSVSWEISERLMELEIRLEIENVVGIEKNIGLVHDFLKKGESVVLISDMYLPKEVIRQMLEKADETVAALPLFVSCEYQKSKVYGSLYPLVKKKMNISYAEWTHYGDNEQSDVRIPALLGIRTVRMIRPESAWGMQGLWDQADVKNDLVWQYFLGTLKNLLWKQPMSEIEKIGAYFGGGLLYPYVDWMLKLSLSKGYRRLYFVARDGYVLKRIADEIIAVRGYDFQTKYIYGSRYAWQTEDNREEVIRYLKQEIDFSDEAFAFVDIQGSGRTMECVSALLQGIYNRPLNVFFYQKYNGSKMGGCNFYVYTFWKDVSHLELFARAPHGATLGYRQEGDMIVPILDRFSEKKCEEIMTYVRGVLLFVREFARVCAEVPYVENELLRLGCMMEQQENEAKTAQLLHFIGDMQHNSTRDDDLCTYAPRLKQQDIFRIFMWRTSEDIRDIYAGDELAVSVSRMNARERRQKEFWERQYYRLPGRLLHGMKHLKTRKAVLPYSKILIYAAGREGQRFYHHVMYQSKSKVAAWTDINADRLRQRGYPVVDLHKALQTDFDVVVIAILSDTVCEAVKQMLMSLGVDEEKIVMLSDW